MLRAAVHMVCDVHGTAQLVGLIYVRQPYVTVIMAINESQSLNLQSVKKTSRSEVAQCTLLATKELPLVQASRIHTNFNVP